VLTPAQMDGLAARIVSGHEERMVAEIMERLVTSLVKGGVLSISDQRTLETAAAMNRDEVARILAEHGPAISKESRRLVERALISSDTGDVAALSSVHAAGAAGSGAAFMRTAQETAEGVAEIIARNNLRMAHQAQAVWYDVASEAITTWNHGAVPVDQVMSRAVSRLSKEGLATIDYASGVKSDIDVAVRRHVVTQVSQASARMTMARLDEYGHDLVYTSAHFGARPDHAVWQGRAFSRSGRTKGYPDLVSVTGYGTVTGLLGANCGHSVYPFAPGITSLPQMPERADNGMTNDELYEATQKQRRHERAVRETKREMAALRQAGLDDTQARLKLGNQQRRLKAFADTNGLPRQPLREKAYGIGAQPRALKVDRRPKVLKMPDRPSSIMEGMPIALPEGGHGRVAPETLVTEVEVFAGRSTSTPFRKARSYAAEFGGAPSQWQHTKGYARVYDGAGVAKRANVHWFEEPTTGVVRPYVKGWSKKQ